jgi:hypothetical protein
MCTHNASVCIGSSTSTAALFTSKTAAGGHSIVRQDNGLAPKSDPNRAYRSYEIFVDGVPAFDPSAPTPTVDNIEIKLDDTLPGFEDTLPYSQYVAWVSDVVAGVAARQAELRNPPAAAQSVTVLKNTIVGILNDAASKIAAL